MTSYLARRLPIASCALALAIMINASPARAVGESSEVETCKKSEIWDTEARGCVPLKGAQVPDKDRASYAYALAEAQRFEEALQVLDTMKDPNTPIALNYRGYATRKLGRTDESIGYYLKALEMAPRYVSAREYLGEAYLTKGRLDLAQEQLRLIESFCGRQCEEYQDLADAIGKAPKS